MRLWSNLGIAIGPALGGFMVATSYQLSFDLAAVGLITFGLMVAFWAKETRPYNPAAAALGPRGLRSYSTVLQDRWFLVFIGCTVLFEMCLMILWVLLGVYAKQNYGVPESQYGLIPATNALMVVLFQVGVTKVTKRYPPLPVMALGVFIFALGVGSIALGQGFWWFWGSFIVVTIGELIVAPTSNTYVANLAPPDQRGRYLGFITLSNGLGSSLAPLLGGGLNDYIGPRAIWLGGGLLGLASSAGFAIMARLDGRHGQKRVAEAEAPA
jgi:MFS family permease